VELLVCVAIIALLLGLLLPALAKSSRAADDAKCLATLRDLSVATMLYTYDYRCMPTTGTLGPVDELDLPPAAWRCRADRERPTLALGSSYAYLASLYMLDPGNPISPTTLKPWLALRVYERNPKLPLYRDLYEWHGYRNQAFWNGAVARWID
jgi:type II secretory pathway pseudopilin PulG